MLNFCALFLLSVTISSSCADSSSRTPEATDVGTITDLMQQMMDRQAAMTEELRVIRLEQSRFMTSLNQVRKRLMNLETKQEDAARTSSSLTGFSAYANESQTRLVGEVVTFPGLIRATPEYNPATSVFTAASTGLYFFTINLVMVDGDDYSEYAGIYKGDSLLVEAYVKYEDSYQQSSQSVLVELLPGEQISVKSSRNTINVWAYAIVEEKLYYMSTFTGFIVAS